MLTCLHPDKGWNTTDVNAYSTVLYLTYGDFTALFTGDVEGEGERSVLDEMEQRMLGKELQSDFYAEGFTEWNKVNITLLKVAHHGSKNSTKEDFLRLVNPRIALISAGRNNRYGHPHEELIERLENCGSMIYRTQRSGAVTVSVRGGKVHVRGGKVRVEEYVSQSQDR